MVHWVHDVAEPIFDNRIARLCLLWSITFLWYVDAHTLGRCAGKDTVMDTTNTNTNKINALTVLEDVTYVKDQAVKENEDATYQYKWTLTLDFSRLTIQDVVEYAARSLVIKFAGNARKAGKTALADYENQRDVTWIVPKPDERKKAVADPVETLMKAGFDRETSVKLLKLAGDDPAKVAEMLKG